MRKLRKYLAFCLGLWVLIGIGSLAMNKQTLREDLIRLHVVANSDSREDQTIKLHVRDAILAHLQDTMGDIENVQDAKAFISESIPQVRRVANDVLVSCGEEPDAVVTLEEETFDTRYYDTFKLPAGIYESLRITIGEGQGKNWWCVVFPSLCLPATSEGFEAVAAGAGFDEALLGALEGEQGYEVRFYLLDLLGKLENKFFQE